ncbi:uncharacterized protein PHACADRAFT_247008 [Phanerochaete carnosa HHB-10118-sp]|uniref:C3H1-type domain-containing protein n=1 Tax=Phanerochaete carnosa (strain HHB-10118-sp) TaxID=650164 RepID=K5XCX2_PHACS|nr:uncharacterized protein PHACADRAFT_247008 [Phanerochaete carnosa HHB-10118-sp]EKM60832.1 hypothetical protein PHACADRAFT_247008 [Phanerochaete carnosa HHB-10118-sp]
MVKLQITEDPPEHKSHLRTPPHLRGHLGVVGIETSPLETSSETSLGSESPNAFDQPGTLGSHSRGSSADTTASSHTPSYSGGQTLHAGPYTPLKVGGMGESRNRPHSYSGGLSSADLLRLQQAGGSPGVPETWSSPNGTPERQAPAEQPTYPSLVGQGSRSQEALLGTRSDETQGSYEAPPRQQYGSLAQGPTAHAASSAAPSAPYAAANRPTGIAASGAQFRQRAFSPPQPVPTVMQSPPNFGYPGPLPLTVAGGQQLYDMMLPTPPLENPAMARLQQQTPYRGVHQHSASDPASLRDPAVLALLNTNMQAAFAAGQIYGPAAMVPPNMAMFNQFYAGPEGYPSPDLAMMARLQPQFTGQYGIPSAQSATAVGSNRQQATQSPESSSGLGPNANNRKLGLYKTELCRSWEEKGSCRYGAKCQFAHGEEELRLVQRHPKYKTEICRTFWVSGSCPYGKRCCFIHTELPGAANQGGGQDNAASHGAGEQRPRSDSDPNEGSTSLLARISAKRQEPLGANKPGSVSTTPPATGFGGRPGSLRVDTSVLDPNAGKQNKSAFPTFTHNGILVSSNDEAPAMSPGPVTAAPDFGRHAAARMDIVGAQPRVRKTTDVNPNLRHSFNGGEIQFDLSATTPTAPNQGQFSVATDMQSQRAARMNGHVRSGSAGNWGSATRAAGHLSAYPLSSIPGGELKGNMPWAEYPASRRAENNWA